MSRGQGPETGPKVMVRRPKPGGDGLQGRVWWPGSVAHGLEARVWGPGSGVQNLKARISRPGFRRPESRGLKARIWKGLANRAWMARLGGNGQGDKVWRKVQTC